MTNIAQDQLIHELMQRTNKIKYLVINNTWDLYKENYKVHKTKFEMKKITILLSTESN